jgi:hypothetical protein
MGTANGQTVKLSKGKHTSPEDGGCAPAGEITSVPTNVVSVRTE